MSATAVKDSPSPLELLRRPRAEAIRGALDAMAIMDDVVREEAAQVIRTLEAWDEVRSALIERPAEAVEAVVFINEPSLVRDVAALADDPSPEVRAAVVSALTRLAAADYQALFSRQLADPHPTVRGLAALGLARAPGAETEATLRGALASETDVGARVLITDALWSVTGGW
ncbi:MAG: HEAT repeat domain-containing protein [Myxococcales bacterium]|nr:HEAT repeat domain-containing protein [Myxococcales bacterium]